ncbi:MAG: phenylalanine--tRNA ligase subunit beta [Candidatus Omnitrophica bacterium]|nr:phenylalanine--tRNA ligase subunit beta [Candidatus Omnitrophota bacterium]
MRFSLNFINEFIKVEMPAEKLASSLTMAGMEVEHFEKIGSDWVFDIEVTSNRYDWLSMIGIAREIAACMHKRFIIKYPQIIKKPLIKERAIFIENSKDCPLYIARSIRNVNVKEPPDIIRERIVNCGVNTINNIVDITNYCMLTWGNPLHAFDEDKLEGNIYVRRAKNGERFIGIDDKERVLSCGNLVIADEKKVIALAGVMGAKNTEVSRQTKNIFLEAAIFSPVTIRRSRRLACLDTDSSYRFERKVFGDYLECASMAASNLIEKIAQGTLAGYREAGKKTAHTQKKLTISLSSLQNYLGDTFPKNKVTRILTSLDFKVKTIGVDILKVTVPAFRLDIEREVDIYEEFIRIYGYDNITAKLPFLLEQKPKISNYHFKNELKYFLTTLGLKEIITYSICADKELEKAGFSKPVKLTNPLRLQENALRPSLLLGMMACVRYNINRAQENIRFFELANVYQHKDGSFCEDATLSLGVSLSRDSFSYLKGVVEELLKYLNISSWTLQEKSAPNFTSALSIVAGNQPVGSLGKLDESVKKEFELKEDLFFAQLDISCLLSARRRKLYKAFSPYPVINRDISIAFRYDIKFKEIEKIIRGSQAYIVDLRIVNTYEGKDLPKGYQAFTIRLFYQSSDKTLTSEEVDNLNTQIRNKLLEAEGVILR